MSKILASIGKFLGLGAAFGVGSSLITGGSGASDIVNGVILAVLGVLLVYFIFKFIKK